MGSKEKRQLRYEKQWMQQTYCYGFGNVVDKENPNWMRIFWTISVLACSSSLALQLYNSFASYLEYSSTTLVSIESTETLPFPSVSVCNFDGFKNARVNTWLHSFSESDRLKDVLHLLLLKSANNLESSPQWFKEIVDSYDNFTAETKRRLKHVVLEDILDELGYQKDEMLKQCEWFGDGRNSTSLGCDQIYFFKMNYGNCITFNPDGGRFTSSHGPYSGLSLLLSGEEGVLLPLDLDRKRYLMEGFAVLVHPPRTSPMQITLNHLMFPRGRHVNVEIEPFKLEMTGPPWGRCSEGKQLRFSRVYTQEMCELECRIVYLQKNCSCRIVGFEEQNRQDRDENGRFKMDNLTRCSILEYIQCVNNFLLSSMGTQLFKSICDCPIPCSMVQYRPHISFADVQRGIENTSSRLSVFFGSKSFVTYQQQPAVTIDQLLSNVGCQCAFFMGMSVATLSEILIYLIKKLLSWTFILGISTPTPTTQQSSPVSMIY